MQELVTNKPEIKIVGITTRTNLQNELTSKTSKIGHTVQRYLGEALCKKIPNRHSPGTTYCIYTDYENDWQGDYTYFVGEEVSSFGSLPEGFSFLTIAPQTYVKFTSESGPMPRVCIDLWQKIGSMTPETLKGRRSYVADFEVYDERSMDPSRVVLDIYVGIEYDNLLNNVAG